MVRLLSIGTTLRLAPAHTSEVSSDTTSRLLDSTDLTWQIMIRHQDEITLSRIFGKYSIYSTSYMVLSLDRSQQRGMTTTHPIQSNLPVSSLLLDTATGYR